RPDDNTAVAARNLPAGAELVLDGRTVALPQRVGLGHKLAVAPIRKGEAVRKYGQIIGFASQDIPTGGHVHVHNVAADALHAPSPLHSPPPRPAPPPPAAPAERRTWMGYDRGPERPDHQRYGSRNYVAVISTVNCSASTNKYISERFRTGDLLKDYPNIDGV